MTAPNRYKRQKKSDRLINPGSSRAEIECDFVLAPFDNACRAMDLKYGTDRLVELVSPDMAQKYGRAMAALNASIEAADAEATKQNAANCAKGLAAMDAAAEAAGAPKADPTIWEYDCDGFTFGIMADGRAWQACKAARPDLALFTMREVGNALRAYQSAETILDAVQEHIPGARISKITPNVDYKRGGDEIPM